MSFICCGGSRLVAVPQYNFHVKNQLWWGGYAKQVYEDNVGGEATQIFATQHLNQPYAARRQSGGSHWRARHRRGVLADRAVLVSRHGAR